MERAGSRRLPQECGRRRAGCSGALRASARGRARFGPGGPRSGGILAVRWAVAVALVTSTAAQGHGSRGGDPGWRGCTFGSAAGSVAAVVAPPLGYLGSERRAAGDPGDVVFVVTVPWLDLKTLSWWRRSSRWVASVTLGWHGCGSERKLCTTAPAAATHTCVVFLLGGAVVGPLLCQGSR